MVSMEDTTLIKWWVDSLYSSHGYIRRHTSGMVSMDKGEIYSTSHKHKLNTKISTETELVEAGDLMPQLLRKRFLGGSGVTRRGVQTIPG